MKMPLRHHRNSKRGSSLPMVMAIGAALTIWVLAFMPLMVTSGTTASQTIQMETDYLSARSAIEYVKGELLNMVESSPPETFAVILDETDGGTVRYATVTKHAVNGPGTNPEYTTRYVDYSLSDDMLDRPKDTLDGRRVAAICSVTQAGDDHVYAITISTYQNGVKGLTYTTTYTMGGTLTILPEAYLQTSALPLSDFVLVDGKLGQKVIWNSTISGKTDTEYREILLAESLRIEDDYADADDFSAVFKKTAEAPAVHDDETGATGTGSPLEDPEPLEWILPTADDFVFDRGTIRAKPGGQLDGIALEGLYTVYYNGIASDRVPAGSGTYRVTLDFGGTDPLYHEAGPNILPVEGLEIATYTVNVRKNTPGDCDISFQTEGDNIRVTIHNINQRVNCGYSVDAPARAADGINWDPNGNWSDGNTAFSFLIASDRTHYFYCRQPGMLVDGIIYEPSDIEYMGMYLPFAPVTKLENNTTYLVYSMTEDTIPGGGSFAGDTGGAVSHYAALCVDDQQASPTVRPFTIDQGANWLDSHVMDGMSLWTAREIKSGSQTFWQLGSGSHYLAMAITQNNRILSLSSTPGQQNTQLSLLALDGEFFVYKQSGNQEGYLILESTRAYLAQNPQNSIFFLPVPDAGKDIPVTEFTAINQECTYGEITPSKLFDIIRAENPAIPLDALYLNGQEITPSDTPLPAGQYLVHAKINGFDYVPLPWMSGSLIVSPSLLTLSGTVDVAVSGYDATVTYSGWSDIGTARSYYGYKMIQNEAGDLVSDHYHWQETASVENLPVGQYEFVVLQGGNNNVVCDTESLPKSALFFIRHPYVEFASTQGAAFGFTLENTGQVAWYRLPNDLWPSRVTLLYGTKNANYHANDPENPAGYNWSATHQANADKYAVTVSNSNITADSPLVVPLPLEPGVSADGLYSNALIAGQALYFMGEGQSIHTHGAKVTVNADLLVLGHEIGGAGDGGRVVVYPYSGESTLLFVVNGFGQFPADHSFYLVEGNTDIASAVVDGAKVRYLGSMQSGELPEGVRTFFQSGSFPVMNADIAYASAEQLRHILSGETMGWTVDGNLINQTGASYNAGDNATCNLPYAVCAYVDTITGETDHSASRILIAGPRRGDHHTLTVPSNVVFRTQYLSIGTDLVMREGNGSVVVHTLGSNANSKSLQVDYQEHTTLPHTAMDRGIYRYACCSDLLDPDVSPITDVVTTYSTIEIETKLNTQNAKIRDRYVRIQPTADENGTLRLSDPASVASLRIYANLIAFRNVTRIELANDSGRLSINSLQMGYDATEYPGLFGDSSTESYRGILLHFQNPLVVGGDDLESCTIPAGMYFVKSPSHSDIDFYQLAKAIQEDEANPEVVNGISRYRYRVDANWLSQNVGYIHADGSLPNTFPENSIVGTNGVSGSTAIFGFAGGSMS